MHIATIFNKAAITSYNMCTKNAQLLNALRALNLIESSTKFNKGNGLYFTPKTLCREYFDVILILVLILINVSAKTI